MFMNFYWMYISVSHFNTFGRQTAETTLLGFYFPVEFSPSFRRQCQNVAHQKWDALPFLWLHAHQKFVIKIIRPNEALHHTLVYNLRFIYVAVTFDNAFMDISIVFNVGIERTSRQFMVSKEAKKRNRRNAKAWIWVGVWARSRVEGERSEHQVYKRNVWYECYRDRPK